LLVKQSLKKKNARKKINLKKKTIKELSLLSLLSLKKTPRAAIRIIAIVFLKTVRSES